jgi:hypothetical protein
MQASMDHMNPGFPNLVSQAVHTFHKQLNMNTFLNLDIQNNSLLTVSEAVVS